MGAGLYSHTTRAIGTILTNTIYNGDHQNHINNHNLAMIDDYSSTVTEMESTADPYPASVASQATSAAGEVERLRYQILGILQALDSTITKWEEDAPASGAVVTLTSTQTLTNKTLVAPVLGDFIEAGTKMVFFQASVPTGWTQDTANNDKCLRIVSGTGGGSGGTLSVDSAVTGTHALTTGELAVHSHTGIAGASLFEASGGSIIAGGTNYALAQIASTADTGSGTAHDHPLDLAYIDVVIGSKD